MAAPILICPGPHKVGARGQLGGAVFSYMVTLWLFKVWLLSVAQGLHCCRGVKIQEKTVFSSSLTDAEVVETPHYQGKWARPHDIHPLQI